MKKYLLGLFAIVLAVGFSAFTTEKSDVNSSTTAYFWYEVDANGDIASASDIINPDVKVTETDLRDGGAEEELLPCEEGSLAPCVRAFNEKLDGQTFPYQASGEAEILKD